MNPSRFLHGGALGFCVFAHALASAEPAKSNPDIALSGDLRLRWERDWDSQNASGVPRTDRERARVRVRLNAAWKVAPEWTISARARTGDHRNQQSPHLTFWSSDDAEDDFDGMLDRYFVQYKKGAVTAWGGRNTIPFWQQNEMFWDEDVTPTGIAGIFESKMQAGTLTTTLGAFRLPDGGLRLNGSMIGSQVRYTVSAGKSKFTFAGGLHQLDGKDGAKYLRNRNGARDYLIGMLSAQWSVTPDDAPPLVFGVDLINNFENYSAADAAPLAPLHADETGGYVLSVLLGKTSAPHDWQLGYFYAHIETLAVNASYSQDDWARFGSGPQADVTDFKGHELRATYIVTKNINVQARIFLVDAITSIQDGKRFRADLNWKF